MFLAYQLSKIKINATILEGSSRLGGRILTIKGKRGAPLELGATWFSCMHSNLLQLVDEFIVWQNHKVLRPHQNYGHPLLQDMYMHHNLFICNTETATEFSGYMEGAIRSVKAMFDKLK